MEEARRALATLDEILNQAQQMKARLHRADVIIAKLDDLLCVASRYDSSKERAYGYAPTGVNSTTIVQYNE